MMIEPHEIPQDVANRGYHVFYDGVAEVWVAAHLSPSGGSGANFAPYPTKREAVARCIQEAGR